MKRQFLDYLMHQCKIDRIKFIDVLRADDSPESAGAIDIWESWSPWKRKTSSMDLLAEESGMTSRRLWEVFNGALMMQSSQVVGAMVALSLPDLMKATIRAGKRPKGESSRMVVYRTARVMPTSPNSVTNINFGTKEVREIETDRGDLPAADQEIMRFSRAMKQQALPAPKESEDDLIQ